MKAINPHSLFQNQVLTQYIAFNFKKYSLVVHLNRVNILPLQGFSMSALRNMKYSIQIQHTLLSFFTLIIYVAVKPTHCGIQHPLDLRCYCDSHSFLVFAFTCTMTSVVI